MSQFVYSVTPSHALEFKRITPDCIGDVVFLLQERNQTLPAYTHWKYGNPGKHWAGGVIAYDTGQPIGCFGLISRRVVCKDGTELECGWFADWYVRPNVQGSGIGTQLLQALKQHHEIVFGHPGPAKAQQICLANGYRPLGFQSRRRLVLLPWQYAQLKTRYRLKALWQLLSERAHVLTTAFNTQLYIPANQVENYPNKIRNSAYFNHVDAYGDWILGQPIASGVRKPGIWHGKKLKIAFVDDTLVSRLKRRLVLYTSGTDRFDYGEWKQFVCSTRAAECMILEMFTTEPDLDHLWARLAAIRIAEAPILVLGLPSSVVPITLHGWDRENWTYLAATY
jgi:GNAT superfamily N-acetyltransferase